MLEATAVKQTDIQSTRDLYVRVIDAFGRADALSEDISQTERIEITHQRISALRKLIEINSKSFDGEMEKLGESDMTAEDYRLKINRMSDHLESINETLSGITKIANQYQQDFL